MIETFRRNALAKNLEEEIGQDRLVLVEGRSRRYGPPKASLLPDFVLAQRIYGCGWCRRASTLEHVGYVENREIAYFVKNCRPAARSVLGQVSALPDE